MQTLLWFAFKILSLTYQKQYSVCTPYCVFSCDLLSKFYLWHIRNSNPLTSLWELRVVICFQNFIFDISETVAHRLHIQRFLLWFAFKILSLTYQKQFVTSTFLHIFRCDLLSKFYLWHIRNSWIHLHNPWSEVVICFQNFIFDISETVQVQWLSSGGCCDLLSKFYLWHIRNSRKEAYTSDM